MLEHIAQFALADKPYHVMGDGRPHYLRFERGKVVEPVLDERFGNATEGVAIVEDERAGVVALAYGSQLLFGFWYGREFSKFTGSVGGKEYWELMGRSISSAMIHTIILLIGSVAFLICLVRWLLAIRRRRRVEAERFSQNL